jgi:phosphate transport system permease protein
MASVAVADRRQPPAIVRPPRERVSSWPLVDRAFHALCWLVGIGLCLIAAAIVLFMLVKGVSYLRLNLLFEHPAASINQSQSGGYLDPIIGTFIVTAIGTVIAAPLGIALAAWLSEYRRPAWLARTVESGIETIAGVPSIALAIFGLLVFSRSFLAFLSQQSAGLAFGESFFNAGIVMSLLALPLIVAATREALSQLPPRLREASYALGKTRATTIWRVLLPSIRPAIATGVVLGMGRIIGDTAIVKVLLGEPIRNTPVGNVPIIGTLRGIGSTLTTYVYKNSPAGEGGAPQKGYAAAFILLMIVLALNALVTRLTSGGGGERGRRRSRAYLLLRSSGVDE